MDLRPWFEKKGRRRREGVLGVFVLQVSLMVLFMNIWQVISNLVLNIVLRSMTTKITYTEIHNWIRTATALACIQGFTLFVCAICFISDGKYKYLNGKEIFTTYISFSVFMDIIYYLFVDITLFHIRGVLF